MAKKKTTKGLVSALRRSRGKLIKAEFDGDQRAMAAASREYRMKLDEAFRHLNRRQQ